MTRLTFCTFALLSWATAAWSQDSPIHKAAAEGDLAGIVALVEQAPGAVNARGPKGQRPMHVAIAAPEGNAAVALLLSKGGDPNATDDLGQSPLHLACTTLPDDRAAHLVNLMHLRRADINLADAAGDGPLHVAARRAMPLTVAGLLRAGADANRVNRRGETPLRAAADSKERSSAADATPGPHPQMVLLLLPHTKEVKGVTVSGEPLAHFVIRTGGLDDVRVILDRKLDLAARNAEGETPLQLAAATGDAARVALLAAAGGDVNAADSSGRTSLYGAAWEGQVALVEILLAAGARASGVPPSQRGDAPTSTPLHAAAWQGQAAVARLLIAHGAAVDARDSDGSTPLHKAVWQGHAEVVRHLLAAGADASARDNSGLSALDHARSRLKDEEKRVAGIKRSWGPEQAAGAPDTPNPGDQGTAWASQGADDKDEWLTLTYPKAVEPARVDVYENYCPGAVVKIAALLDDGREMELWSGTDPTPVASGSGVSKIAIEKRQKTDRIKVYVASSKVSGWNEIDAVGLVDAAGDVQWATRVQASSTYASGPDASNKFIPILELLQG